MKKGATKLKWLVEHGVRLRGMLLFGYSVYCWQFSKENQCGTGNMLVILCVSL